MLLVGNPALPLKGFDVALTVLSAVNAVLPIRVAWVCQSEPSPAQLPVLSRCGLQLELYVNRPQVRQFSRRSGLELQPRSVVPCSHSIVILCQIEMHWLFRQKELLKQFTL